jgi:hypothetical protein
MNPAAAYLPTVAVVVVRPVESQAVDSMGEPIAGEPQRETVTGALFEPSGTSALTAALAMDGVRVDAVFAFPDSYTASLRGCSIEHGGHVYEVIGDPQPVTESPLPWNRDVETREVE